VSAPPDVAFDYDTRFVEMDLRGDARTWARSAAETAFEQTGHDAGRHDVKRLAGMLETLAERTREMQPVGAFALVPEPWAGVAGIVRVTPVDLAGQPLDRLLAEMTMNEAELAAAPETGRIETAAGDAVWLRQRIVGAGSEVTEDLEFVWHFPREDAALVLGIGFSDLLEAARWRPAIHDLARGISLVTASDR
jgi:hypothetical protein